MFTGPQITHPECGWTAWINSGRPSGSIGSGDVETFSMIRRIHKFCTNPIMVECRDVYTHVSAKDSSQKVTCDLSTGLKCLNWENNDVCNDYELRFFCPCLCKSGFLKVILCASEHICSIVRYCFRSFKQL